MWLVIIPVVVLCVIPAAPPLYWTLRAEGRAPRVYL